jgi:hypothetical protein
MISRFIMDGSRGIDHGRLLDGTLLPPAPSSFGERGEAGGMRH